MQAKDELDWTTYRATARYFAELGFNAIPLPPRAKGLGNSGILYADLNKPESRRITREDVLSWRLALTRRGCAGKVGAYLLPNSNCAWSLVIVDIDDPDYLHRMLTELPPTPATTSRQGRTRHLYYRTRDPRRTHMLQAFGRGTVDFISATGVVLPGSIHPDGTAYEGDIRNITSELPELPLSYVDALRKVRTKVHRKEMAVVRREAASKPGVTGFIHAFRAVERRHSLWCGWVLPTALIRTADEGVMPMSEIPTGTKCYAMHRDDAKPSAHVSDYKGVRHFFDMSSEPRKYWTMVDSPPDDYRFELDEDSILGYTDQLANELRDRMAIEVEVEPSDGYLRTQDVRDNEVVFLVAQHGAGKTVYARTQHKKSRSCLSVCNTQALTVANAAVLGLTPVYDNITARGSCCLPSILKYTGTPPDFLHVDEADAVLAFLQSGVVRDPLQVWLHLFDLASRAERCLFASADLRAEDILLIVDCIRARTSKFRFRAILKRPKPGYRTIRLCKLAEAKATIHREAKAGGEYPLFIGSTTRRVSAQIAHGYQSDGRPAVDLPEAADVIDTPRPAPLSDDVFAEGESISKGQSFFASGENSRYVQTIHWLRDPSSIVREHALICTSPAVQSGVSLDPPIRRVIILHQNRAVAPTTVLQIALRARDPKDKEILIGTPTWLEHDRRSDSEYLQSLVHMKTRTTIAGILEHFPEEGEAHKALSHPEFLRGWQLCAARAIEASADPLGQLRIEAARFEIDIVEEEEKVGEKKVEEKEEKVEAEGKKAEKVEKREAKSFSKVTAAAFKVRTRINAKQTSEAPTITKEEQSRLSAAPQLETGERQTLDRSSIETFYGMLITPSLVVLDNDGAYRETIRRYAHAVLLFPHEAAIAYQDHIRGRGVEPTRRTHLLAQSYLVTSLHRAVTGGEMALQSAAGDDVVERTASWYEEHGAKFRAFFPSTAAPAKSPRWFCDRMRAIGATVGGAKFLDFTVANKHAQAYIDRVLDAYINRNEDAWKETWKRDFTV